MSSTEDPDTPHPSKDKDRARRRTKPESRGDLLTRYEVARILKVSPSSVDRMRGTFLHPVFDGDGRPGSLHARLYDPKEVEKVRNSKVLPGRVYRQQYENPDLDAVYDGLMAAKAFELFTAGRKLSEVVVELQVHPAAVKAMHAEWARLDSAFTVTAEQAKELEGISWLEGELPIRDGAHLVQILKAQNPELCSSCQKRAPGVCEACARLPRR